MARPTNDKKESTIILRVNNEIRGNIEKKAKNDGTSLSEAARSMLCGSVIQNKPIAFGGVPSETIEDLQNMIRLCGITECRFMEEVARLMNEGGLTVEGLDVVPHGELDMTSFYEVCHAKGYEPQETLEKVVKLLWK